MNCREAQQSNANQISELFSQGTAVYPIQKGYRTLVAEE
jgi:hypothetical protein